MAFHLQYIEKKEICKDTHALYFDITGKDFYYKAGQYASVTIPILEAKDGKGNKRHFSIANAPGENNFIEIITRKSGSDFSGKILNLVKGDELVFENPAGEINADSIHGSPVFIAGGTGITPVRSIISYWKKKRVHKRITLFYANRTAACAPFMDEFRMNESSSFEFIPVFEEGEEERYEKGVFNEEIFRRYTNDISERYYYITGPPAMLSEAIKILVKAGVRDERIFIENV